MAQKLQQAEALSPNTNGRTSTITLPSPVAARELQQAEALSPSTNNKTVTVNASTACGWLDYLSKLRLSPHKPTMKTTTTDPSSASDGLKTPASWNSLPRHRPQKVPSHQTLQSSRRRPALPGLTTCRTHMRSSDLAAAASHNRRLELSR